MPKKYKVKLNGYDYTLTVSEQTTDQNGMLLQKLRIDDTEIVIREIEENGSRRVVIDGEIESNKIPRLLDLRAKSGNATQLEKIAYYQLEHMRSAEAEQIVRLSPTVGDRKNWNDVKETPQWKNRTSDPSYKKLNLSHEQIVGTEPLPDLDKEFPWRTSYIKFADGVLGRLKGTNAAKRNFLEKLRDQRYIISQDMLTDRITYRLTNNHNNSITRHNIALQERSSKSIQEAKDKLGIEAPADEGTERLFAAAKTREDTKKENNKTEKTTLPKEQTIVTQGKDFDMG